MHVFYENMDPRGAYHSLDLGNPPSNPAWYRVARYGDTANVYHCSDGTAYNGYRYKFKLGTSKGTAYIAAYGVMGTNDGRADANTEVHGTPIQPTVLFGCQSQTSCNNTVYGIEKENHSSQWSLLTSGVTRGPDKPPYRHTINSYWSFWTCQTHAACS